MLMRHTLIYSLSRGMAGVFNIVAIMMLTRLLPPSEYGIYALIVTATVLVNALFFQWIRMSLLRYYESHEDRPRLLSTIVAGFHIVLLAACALAAVLALLWADLRSIGWIVVETVAYLWLYAWFELNLTLYRTRLQPAMYGYLFVAKNVLTLSAAVALVALGYGIHGLMLGMIAGTLVPVAVSAARQWRGVSLRLVDYKLMLSLAKYGAPLTVSFTMGFVIYSAGRVMLGWLSGVEDTGLYAVSYDLTQQSIILLMTIVNLAAYPLAVKKLEKQGEEAARKQLGQNAVLILLVSVPATAGLIVLAPNLSGVLLGEAYRETALTVFPVIAIAAFVQGLKQFYFDLSFQLSRETKKQMIPVVAAVAVTIALNLWWIPLWGIAGAAYASLVSYAIGTAMSIAIGNRVFRLPFPVKDFIKIAASAIAMSLLLLPLRDYGGPVMLAVQIAYGALVFGVLVWALKVSGVKEWPSAVLSKLRLTRPGASPRAGHSGGKGESA